MNDPRAPWWRRNIVAWWHGTLRRLANKRARKMSAINEELEPRRKLVQAPDSHPFYEWETIFPPVVRETDPPEDQEPSAPPTSPPYR